MDPLSTWMLVVSIILTIVLCVHSDEDETQEPASWEESPYEDFNWEDPYNV